MENACGCIPQGRIEEKNKEVRSSQREENKERKEGREQKPEELSTRRSQSVLKGQDRQTLASNVTKVQNSCNYAREPRKARKPVSFP